jgi:hypothetical protein
MLSSFHERGFESIRESKNSILHLCSSGYGTDILTLDLKSVATCGALICQSVCPTNDFHASLLFVDALTSYLADLKLPQWTSRRNI